MSKVEPKQPKSIYFRKDWIEALIDHPEELRHKICDAIFRYVLYGDMPNDAQVKYSLFPLIQKQLQDDAERYAEVCEKRRAGVVARWEREQNTPENTSECTSIDKYTSECTSIDKYTQVDNRKEIEEKRIEENRREIKEMCVCDKSHNTTHTHAHTHEENLFIKFLEWSKEFAPLSLQFKEALTLEHFLWLMQNYGEQKVKRCAQALHNKEAHKHNRRAITAWQNYIKKM